MECTPGQAVLPIVGLSIVIPHSIAVFGLNSRCPGFHFRNSVFQGERLGNNVADRELDRYLKPAH